MAVERRLLTALMAFFLLLPSLSPFAAGAADPPTTIPGFSPFGDGVSINYLISGEIDPNEAAAHVIVERITLDKGDIAPFPNATQIMAVEKGRLTLIDDLGLTASLKEGRQTFAPTGAFSRISAATPTTLLRARIVAPIVDITITEDSCTPTTLTRAPGSTLVIENQTAEIQPFAIASLAIDVEIPAGQVAEVPLQAAEQGSWVASCGRVSADGSSVDVVTLTIADVAPAAATPSPSIQGTDVLFDGHLDLPTGSATFFLAELAMTGQGSLGEQTMSGPTGIVAGDQPLQIERPGKAKATLEAGGQVLLPAETVATISNPGDSPTTMLVFSLSPIAEATPEQPTPEPTTEPTSEPEPTTIPPATPPTDLESYLPSDAAVEELGLIQFLLEESASVEDTPYAEFPVADQWSEGLTSGYAPELSDPGILGGVIFVDRFTSSGDTSRVLTTVSFGLSTSSDDELVEFDLPASFNADDAVGFQLFETSEVPGDGFVIIAAYDEVIVWVTLVADPGTPGAQQLAIDLWMAIDAEH